MPETDLDLLIDAAREAGRIATRYSGETARRWEKPDGAGPVTEADLAVNEMLERVLRAARPDYGWLSEESDDDADRLGRANVFIIDPIDGTRSFAEGKRTWAHSLAVARDGVVTDGVVFLPQRDLMYHASAGQGAFLNGTALTPSARDQLDGAEVLATKANMKPEHWPGGLPRINRAHRPSLAYRMAVVAQGRFDAMLTLRPAWEWDIAAGDVILREAGARITDRTGQPLRFNSDTRLLDGVVAAPAPLHEALMRHLGTA